MNERTIFMTALEKETSEQRSAFLEEACAGDLALRQRIEALLRSHEQAGSFLGKSAPERMTEGLARIDGDAETQGERPGCQIGPYKLLQQIGEGGMGVVWMAEQLHPIQRKVALKVIKPGMDSKQVMARFEAERQALAMMDHVNIARVFDGGTTGVRGQEAGGRGQGAGIRRQGAGTG